MDHYLNDKILRKDFVITKNNYEITQEHLTALSGTYNKESSQPLDLRKDTVFHYLARSGNYEALKQAIKDHEYIKKLKNYRGDTIFHYLALSGNYEALKQAISDYKYSYDTDELKNTYKNTGSIKRLNNNNGDSVFHYLALSGNYEALKQAMNDYFLVEVKNNYGANIFHYLGLSGNYEAIRQAINDHEIKIKIGDFLIGGNSVKCSTDDDGCDIFNYLEMYESIKVQHFRNEIKRSR